MHSDRSERVHNMSQLLKAYTLFEKDVEYVVQDGKVITSRGPGTAMDFALHLIEVLVGKDKRNEVEAGLQRPL